MIWGFRATTAQWLMRPRRGLWLLGLAAVAAIALTLGGSPLARGTDRARRGPDCLNAQRPGLPELRVRVAEGPHHAPGRVLPGPKLKAQTPDRPRLLHPSGLTPHYPGGRLPSGPLRWRSISGVPRSRLIHETAASEVFNAPSDRYRIAFNESYYGVEPTNIGDFNGDGVDDLAIPDHYAFVDGKPLAGEVDVYYGRKRRRIDPRRDVPDLIFYGSQAQAKFGISVARAGDVNGDGHDDLLIASAFYSGRGTRAPFGGRAYLVYGGYLDRFRCPVKVRAEEIGTRVPGIVFDGGRDGSRYLGWANELDSGDFNGDGLSDIVIGSYDPYPGSKPTFPARAYVIYGSRRLPRHLVGYRLGVDMGRRHIRSTTYTMPDGSLTRESLGFSASFVGDLSGSGHDDLAFSAGLAGSNHRGEDYIFFAPPSRSQATVPIQTAPLTIYADSTSSPALQFDGLEGVRPNGDVYGDGHHDALLSARFTEIPLDGRWQQAGAVGILRGREHFPPRLGFSALDTIIYGSEIGEAGEPSMASGADFNGDGCTDIVVNDPAYLDYVGNTLQQRGRFWLLLGSPSLDHLIALEPSASRIVLANNHLPGELGFNWTTGDFNRDGRPDLVAADEYEGDGQLQDFVGRTDLFYNSALHLPWHQSHCRS